MRKLFSILFVMLFTMNIINAQEAYVKYEFTDVTSDNEQMQMQLQMLKGTQSESIFKGDIVVSTMNMMGGMVSVTTKIDNKTEKADLLMDAMGQKFWVESTTAEIKKMNKEKEFGNEDVVVTYDKKDTKTLHGMDAYKFNISLKENKGDGANDMNVSGYITEEVQIKQSAIKGFEKVVLNGLPLEMTIVNPMMTIKMSAVDFRKEVKESELNIDTAGYKKMTIDELKAMGMGAM